MKTVFYNMIFQVLLNIAWNFVFFNQHLIAIGLVVISALTLVITLILMSYLKLMKTK